MFGTDEQTFVLTNKQAFKEFCIKNGVDTILTYTDKDINNDTVEYPVLVKPIDSRGSRGSSVCRNKEEVMSAIMTANAESRMGGSSYREIYAW